MRPPPGNAPLTSSICVDMDRAVGTRAVTHVQRSLHGVRQSRHGSRVIAPSTSTSTMTKKAPRRWTRWRYSACWPTKWLGSGGFASRAGTTESPTKAPSDVSPGEGAGTKSALAASSPKRCSRDAAGRLSKGEPVRKGRSNLFLGGLYALTTAALLATQAPLSFLAAKQLSVAVFIGATELILLLCVPFMLRTRRSREHFVALLSSASNLAKFGVLLLIGLIGIVLYVFGLGRGHPIVIAAVLNLDPFWAAVIAYLVAGQKIPTSLLTFTLCLIASFVGAMLLAVSQTDAQSIGLQMFDSGSFLAPGLALPVPILWALSGTLVGKWFSDFDDYACIAVTFTMAAAVVVP